MNFEITTSTPQDITAIFKLYAEATAFQKTKNLFIWPTFEAELIENEINELRQFKLLINNEIACVWAIAYNDPQIWGARDKDPAIYIHRIATNPNFRGFGLVKKLVVWAKAFSKTKNKRCIRLDTVGNNAGLIGHYQQCGFTFLGLYKLSNTEGLPAHYKNADVSLFEIEVV